MRARDALLGMKHLAAIDVEVVEHPDRDSYRAWLADKSKVELYIFVPSDFLKLLQDFGPRGSGHTSSPVSWLGDNDVRADKVVESNLTQIIPVPWWM